MISYSPFVYLCLPNAELEQINEQEDVAVATLNAPSLAEICIAIGRGQKSKKLKRIWDLIHLIIKQGGNYKCTKIQLCLHLTIKRIHCHQTMTKNWLTSNVRMFIFKYS